MTHGEPMVKAASVATYVGGTGAVFFGLSASEFAAMIGAGVAVLGFLVNVWFRWQHLRLVEAAAKQAPGCVVCPERSV